ncbi:MAG: prenyltransferase [Patescibacteria group bacterium]
MTLQRILKISRPRFWIYELGPYLLGLAATLPLLENPAVLLDVRIIAFFIYFLFPANLLIYGINDIFDYETDKLNPKKVAYESLLMPAEHKYILIAVLLTTLPFVFFLDVSNIPSVIGFAAFIFFASFYSASPIRAKTKPGFDMIFSAGHYVATGVFTYALISGVFPSALPIIGGMLWAMAMHAYSAVPDIDADKTSGIATVATVLTKKPTLVMCTVFYIVSAIIAYTYIGAIAVLLLVPYLLLMIMSLNSSEEKLFKLYTYFPKLNTIVGMIVFWSIVFLRS